MFTPQNPTVSRVIDQLLTEPLDLLSMNDLLSDLASVEYGKGYDAGLKQTKNTCIDCSTCVTLEQYRDLQERNQQLQQNLTRNWVVANKSVSLLQDWRKRHPKCSVYKGWDARCKECKATDALIKEFGG